MKKIFFALTAISLLPITANAKPKQQTTVSNATIQATIKQFQPVFCKGPKAMTEAIQNCYQSVQPTDPKIDRCIIADLTFFSSISNENKKRKALSQPLLLKDITFLSDDAFLARYNTYMKPRLQKVNNKPMFAYYKPAGPVFSRAIASSCSHKNSK